jgi:hypothetical protein
MTILLGCIIGSFAVLTPLTQMMVPKDQQVGIAALIPALSMYAILGVALIWLGIGSIMARRWARALLLIFSWSWLVLGVFEMVAMAFFMPKAMANAAAAAPSGQPQPPAGTMDFILVIMFLFLGFIFLVLPGLWTFFYSSRHVKATCESRDPAPSWTDACPLPMMALMPFTGHPVMPLFGVFLTGAPAVLVCVVFAVVWGMAGWLLFRVDVRGWWLILVGITLGAISTVVTFAQRDFTEIYRLMDYPQAQIDQIQKLGFFQGGTMAWLMGFSMVPFLGYLLFIRRYFRR